MSKQEEINNKRYELMSIDDVHEFIQRQHENPDAIDREEVERFLWEHNSNIEDTRLRLFFREMRGVVNGMQSDYKHVDKDYLLHTLAVLDVALMEFRERLYKEYQEVSNL